MPALDDVKAALRISDADSDTLLTRLIASATGEYVQFTGVDTTTPVDVDALPEDARNGIVLMVQADYDGDPALRDKYLDAARSLWQPYRVDGGV